MIDGSFDDAKFVGATCFKPWVGSKPAKCHHAQGQMNVPRCSPTPTRLMGGPGGDWPWAKGMGQCHGRCLVHRPQRRPSQEPGTRSMRTKHKSERPVGPLLRRPGHLPTRGPGLTRWGLHPQRTPSGEDAIGRRNLKQKNLPRRQGPKAKPNPPVINRHDRGPEKGK